MLLQERKEKKMAEKMYKKLNKRGGMSIPASVRREMGWEPEDAMELEVTQDNRLIMRQHQPRCVFCGETEGVVTISGKGICSGCIAIAAGKEASHEQSEG